MHKNFIGIQLRAEFTKSILELTAKLNLDSAVATKAIKLIHKVNSRTYFQEEAKNRMENQVLKIGRKYSSMCNTSQN